MFISIFLFILEQDKTGIRVHWFITDTLNIDWNQQKPNNVELNLKSNLQTVFLSLSRLIVRYCDWAFCRKEVFLNMKIEISRS